MDNSRGFRGRGGLVGRADDEPAIERPPEIGVDERRMHVRAYNYWVSLLAGRPIPRSRTSIRTRSRISARTACCSISRATRRIPRSPSSARALRVECELDAAIRQISEVPSRSLLSRLTDHYLQIIANCAPIGFEAEFVGQRGHNTLYRGILMPLSSDGETIDFIYGVINWKEIADSETAVRARRRGRPRDRRRAGAAGRLRRRLPGLGGRPQCRFRRGRGDRRPRRAGRRCDPEPVARRAGLADRLVRRARQRRGGGRRRPAQPRRALPRARPRL